MKLNAFILLSALLVFTASALPSPQDEPGQAPVSTDGGGGDNPVVTDPNLTPPAEDNVPPADPNATGYSNAVEIGDTGLPGYTVGAEDKGNPDVNDKDLGSCSSDKPVKEVSCELSEVDPTNVCAIEPQCGEDSNECFAPGKRFGLINDRINVCMKVLPYKSTLSSIKGFFGIGKKKLPELRLVVVKCSRNMAFKTAGPHTFAWEAATGNKGGPSDKFKLVHFAWVDGKEVKLYAVRRKHATFFYEKTNAATMYTINKTKEKGTFQILEAQSEQSKCLTVNPFYSRVTSRPCGKSKCYRQQLWKKVRAVGACDKSTKYEDDKKDYGDVPIEGYGNDGPKEQACKDTSNLPPPSCDTPAKEVTCDEGEHTPTEKCGVEPKCGEDSDNCFAPGKPFGLFNERIKACAAVAPYLSKKDWLVNKGKKFLNFFGAKLKQKLPELRLVVQACSKDMLFKSAGPHTFAWEPATSNKGGPGDKFKLVHFAWDGENKKVLKLYAVRRKYATFFYETTNAATMYTVNRTNDPKVFQILQHAESSAKCLTANPFYSRITSQTCGKSKCYRQQTWRKVRATAPCP